MVDARNILEYINNIRVGQRLPIGLLRGHLRPMVCASGTSNKKSNQRPKVKKKPPIGL